MIKFKQGWIQKVTGEKQDIIVEAAAPNKLKDIVIGGGMALVGIIYLTYTAFRNGAKAHEAAEFKTMEDLGLLGEPYPVADLTDSN
jgi:hypothetical protein